MSTWAVTRSFLERVRARAVGAEVAGSLTPGQQVVKIVHDELITTLGREASPLAPARVPPQRILMVGLQGSGKTTTAAKLALRLKSSGKHPLLVAADLQRPAAIDQLETLGTRIGVPVHVRPVSTTPPKLAKAALKRAGELGCDVVIVDTAGRLQIDEPLMDELAAVRKVVEPDEVLLVVDAMTGQDAVNVARGFLERTEITGLIFSKLDGDARGGAAISAREVTGRPIKFVGVGEGLDGLEVFHPERMASRILGMGDVLTLIEKAEATWDREQARRPPPRRCSGPRSPSRTSSTSCSKCGGWGLWAQLLGMLPGAASALGSADLSDEALSRAEAIIRSMTPGERRNPKLIDGGRRRRIAAGSGTSPQTGERVAAPVRRVAADDEGFRRGPEPHTRAGPAGAEDEEEEVTHGGEDPPDEDGQEEAAELPSGGRRRARPRDGRYIEQIGRYDPRQEPSVVEIDSERASYWLQNGAQPSEPVRRLLADCRSAGRTGRAGGPDHHPHQGRLASTSWVRTPSSRPRPQRRPPKRPRRCRGGCRGGVVKGEIVERVVTYVAKAIAEEPEAVRVDDDRRGARPSPRRGAHRQARHGPGHRSPRPGGQRLPHAGSGRRGGRGHPGER